MGCKLCNVPKSSYLSRGGVTVVEENTFVLGDALEYLGPKVSEIYNGLSSSTWILSNTLPDAGYNG